MWNMLHFHCLTLRSFLSDALANLVGQQNARYGIIKIFNALQEANANKHLLYVRIISLPLKQILQLLIYHVTTAIDLIIVFVSVRC